ncbi:MAG TPA: organomercurial lyase [Longimicrobiales bacterium]|nr:organomercurial lyase [Longimicrobiales bacterium]
MSGPKPVLDDFHWALRTEIYRHVAETTEAPSLEALAAWAGRTHTDVLEALDALEANHHIALLPDRTGIWMANPFSATPTAFPVDTPRGLFWANCAWDALGVPAILGVDGWTETRCAGSGEPISFGVRGGERQGDDGLIHLVVPPRHAWDDIGFT